MTALKNMQSTLSTQSFISPIKNRSSFAVDTQASLHYSDLTQNSTLLKLQSINNQRSINFQLLPIETCRQLPFHQQQPQQTNNQNRIKQLFLLQKFVSEAYIQYTNNKIQINVNQQRIGSLQRDNKYRKMELIHLKNMTEHLRKRQKKIKKRIKMKRQQQQRQYINQMNSSKQRAAHYFEQIKKLKQQIYEQKKVRKQMQWNKKLRNQEQNKLSRNYTFNSQNMNSASHGPQTFYQNQFNCNSMNSFGNVHTSSKQSNPQTKRSFDPASTPNFVSKKNSLEDQFSSQNFNTNLLMDALTAHLNNITFSNTSLPRQNSNPLNTQQLNRQIKLIKSSGKKSGWENSQQQMDVLNMMQEPNRRNGHLKAETPHFNPKFNNKQQINFSKLHQIKSAQVSQNSTQRERKFSQQNNNIEKQSPKKNTNKKPSSINSSQSHIRIQVQQSVSSMSKYDIQRRKFGQGRKAASTERKIIQQWQNTVQNEQDEDAIRDKSPTLPQKKISANSSFQKIQLDEAYQSQIISKRLAPPPNLLNNNNYKNKKLRKVTEQQSDLFDSNGYPKMHNRMHSRQKSNNIQVEDVILDQQNLKQSQFVQKPNSYYQSIPSIQEQTIVKFDNNYHNKNKIAEEDNDDDDFFKINLAAVSKISKEKQLSQKPVIVQYQNFQYENEQFPIYKSQNIVSKSKVNKTLPVKQEINIASIIKHKRENQQQRTRKASGSRFSEIIEPIFQPTENFVN